MERVWCGAFAVFFLALTSFRVAVSVITLQCDSLQQLCPDDDLERMCVCNSTEGILVLTTSTSGGIATFTGGTMVGTTRSQPGFTAVLTVNSGGVLTSTLTFNTSTVRAVGSGGIDVTCDDAVVTFADMDNLVVTPAVVPGVRQIGAHSVSCDPTGNTYQTALQWNDGDTGGPNVSILYYLVEVTSTPAGFVCPSGQCNITTPTTNITGLSCSTEYSFTVRAVNCVGTSIVSVPLNITTPTPNITAPVIGQPCFVDGMIRVPLMQYTGGCYTVNNFNASSNCTDESVIAVPSDSMLLLSAVDVLTNESCEVSVAVLTNCGTSALVTGVTNGECPTMPPTPTPSMTTGSMSSSSIITTTDNPITTTIPDSDGLGVAAGAGGGGAAAVGVLAALIATICVCVFCPCACCMPCRRMCCCCCSEEKICCGGDDGEYSEPTPHVEKQPVLQSYSKEANEKDVETGQHSYPPGPLYQDPNTIQRQAAPTTGDLYAQPERPARNRPQQPAAVEMATYQDPNTIQRQAAPTTGDLYAQPDKPPKTPAPPAGQAPLYSMVDKQNSGGMVYADLSHSEAPAGVRRPPPTPETFYAEVRDSRT